MGSKYIIGKQFVTLQCLVLLPSIKTYLVMRFGKGWVAFLKDNNSEEGDVCVFKVIERKPVVLSVSIFHDALPPRKQCIAKVAHLCIQVSWDGYLRSRFNSADLLSIICRTASIKCGNDGQLTPKILLTLLRNPLHP
ncbi:hypothetical protein CFP56_025976 [Quercus suber]|uniref:TF-B3 domain-containing protein n=1 Tax=Quercus suber TaxID=58331 RepID=A0AAW0LWI2_QUESU